MKCRLCSSGLYICMIRFLSRSACSSLVNLPALLELSATQKAALIANSLRGRLFMESVRGGTRFLSDYLMSSPMPEKQAQIQRDSPEFWRSALPDSCYFFDPCDWRSLSWFP